MTIEEQLRFEKNNNYLLAKELKKEKEKNKELQKQLKEAEKGKYFWKDACMRMKEDKR